MPLPSESRLKPLWNQLEEALKAVNVSADGIATAREIFDNHSDPSSFVQVWLRDRKALRELAEVQVEHKKRLANSAPPSAPGTGLRVTATPAPPRPAPSQEAQQFQKAMIRVLGNGKWGAVRAQVLAPVFNRGFGDQARAALDKAKAAPAALPGDEFAFGTYSNLKQAILNDLLINGARFVANMGTVRSAMEAATKSFDENVGANLNAVRSQLGVAKAACDALGKAPVFGLLGKVASVAIGTLDTGKVNAAATLRPLKEYSSSSFVDALSEKFTDATTLFNLKDILPNETYVDFLGNLCNWYVAKLTFVATEFLDEYFGDAATMPQRFIELRNDFIENNGWSEVPFATRAGTEVFTQQLRLAFRNRIVAYQEALKKEINNRLLPVYMPTVSPEDMRLSIELYRYAEYIGSIYKGGGDRYKLPVGDKVISFLKNQPDWGILSDADNHEVSDAQGRLNWKGGENHKRLLHLFCQWYVKNINPFWLITRPLLGSEQVTARVLQNMMRDEIRRINKAKNHGRGTLLNKLVAGGWFSLWDWEKIYAQYHQLSNVEQYAADDWVDVDEGMLPANAPGQRRLKLG